LRRPEGHDHSDAIQSWQLSSPRPSAPANSPTCEPIAPSCSANRPDSYMTQARFVALSCGTGSALEPASLAPSRATSTQRTRPDSAPQDSQSTCDHTDGWLTISSTALSSSRQLKRAAA